MRRLTGPRPTSQSPLSSRPPLHSTACIDVNRGASRCLIERAFPSPSRLLGFLCVPEVFNQTPRAICCPLSAGDVSICRDVLYYCCTVRVCPPSRPVPSRRLSSRHIAEVFISARVLLDSSALSSLIPAFLNSYVLCQVQDYIETSDIPARRSSKKLFDSNY